MSDNWIIVIPQDPTFVPDAARAKQVEVALRKVAPKAESIDVETTETVQFIHCFGNFERVHCPSCGKEIDENVWTERMDADLVDDGFRLAKYPWPCCGARLALHELRTKFETGFARFSVSAMNPNVGKVSDAQQRALEAALGAPVRIIYRHV